MGYMASLRVFGRILKYWSSAGYSSGGELYKDQKVWERHGFRRSRSELGYVTAPRTSNSDSTAYPAAMNKIEHEPSANKSHYIDRPNARPAAVVAGAKTLFGGVWLLGLRQHE
jgi:hypothetical protein